MDFEFSPRTEGLRRQLLEFMERYIIPAMPRYASELAAGGRHPLVVEELKQVARSEGLWNLFLPGLQDDEPGQRLSNLEYAPLAEIMGRVAWASEVFNCSAPDTGNMEILHLFATPGQRERWLDPLLEGTLRSCFAMTEPDTASSDATNIQTSIRRAGDQYVINGRKWFISGAAHPHCKVAIVMGVTDPDGPPHRRQSMVLVPLDAPSVERLASTSLAMLWTWGRVLRLADGPDEVHLRSVAKQEMQRSGERRDALDVYLTPGANGMRAAT